ncbi:MAG: ABC transporter substrate-binding protein [Lachnospiraceae bacterium]|nr:ABC transporter substrate-binding protein [Lachnospiraceae bacterium]
MILKNNISRRKNKRCAASLAVSLLLLMLLLSGCQGSAGEVTASSDSVPVAGVPSSVSQDGPDYSKVADSSDYAEGEGLDDSGLTPVTASELNDGDYLLDIECSSSMFRVADTLLSVHDGKMEAKLRIESDSYLFLYPGTGKEAAADTVDSYIGFVNNDAGDQIYTVPVEALDKALSFASYSKNKEQWYDRTLIFLSSSLPDEAFKVKKYKTPEDINLEDGNYYVDVNLSGGSGKASVDSPALLMVSDREAYAMITWSSSNYDYMIVDDMKIDTEIIDDRSTFVIPVRGFDYEMPVKADTTAMSTPHEIEYTLYFDSASICVADPEGTAVSYRSMKAKEKIKPEYATKFSIDSYEDGIYGVTVEKDRYLFVPKSSVLPAGIPENVTVIRTPVSHAYVASSSSMDFFKQTGTLNDVGSVSLEDSKWTDSDIASLVSSGTITYVGKYDAPDYESLLKGNADIAVENTMIYHSPETKEKLEELSIPVFVDLTSYEDDPRGRVEWIKIYGIMTGEYEKAVAFFDGCVSDIDKATEGIEKPAQGAPKVSYFYISPKGHVSVRNSEDYISRMIEMAGGEYTPTSLKVKKGEDKSSTVDMSMEDFYLKAKDADILIYNSTIYGNPGSIDKLTSQTALLDEFKAVKEGRVYASGDDLFQATCAASDVISDLCGIVSGDYGDLKYFTRLK